MGEISYLDFDLLIERAGEGYVARVTNSPAGQATLAFTWPFSELELENFWLRVGRTRQGVRRLESPEMKAAKVFGGRLFEAVFGGAMRGCLRSSMDEAARQGTGLRVRLRLADVAELADAPWEYLYNSTVNRFFSLSVETPLVRYMDLPERIRPLAVKPPLRVLVMISSPSDYPRLDVEREWTKLKEALGELEGRGLVALERLEEATLGTLQRRLRRGEYHIFHFIGHGGFDEQAQDGVLLLEDEEERGRPVSGHYLGTLMHDERTLRLAVLNACEGARTSRTDPFAGVAQSLVQQGVPAVIAMQSEITDQAAITLAHEFYAALADGYPVDAALAEARKAIFAQENDVEWGKPVLYMRAPDGRVFDVERASEAARKSARVAALYREAQAALAGEDWNKALEKLQAVLALEPAHGEALAALDQARRKQELATLYARGQVHYEASRWREALEYLRQVRELEGDYKDVGTLVSIAERESAREEEAPVARPVISVPSRWLWVGIPAALVLLAVIIFAGSSLLGGKDITPTPQVNIYGTATAQAATVTALAQASEAEQATATAEAAVRASATAQAATVTALARASEAERATATAEAAARFTAAAQTAAAATGTAQAAATQTAAAILTAEAIDVTPPIVQVAFSPPNPTVADQIAFIASASDDEGLERIEILVNARLAKTCTASPCTYVGGPYPAGSVNYGVNAYDRAGNRAWTGYSEFMVVLPSVFVFDTFPDRTRITNDVILGGDEFSAWGLRLGAAPGGAYCADARAAIRAGDDRFTTPFLTTASPDDTRSCNTVPVRLEFTTAVRSVTLRFSGATAEYVLTAYDRSGRRLGTSTKLGQLGRTDDVTFSSTSANVAYVEFGRQLAMTRVFQVTVER